MYYKELWNNSLENHGIGEDAFNTTSLFWDCECEKDYIHPQHEPECKHCGMAEIDSPDARETEVLEAFPYIAMKLAGQEYLLSAAHK